MVEGCGKKDWIDVWTTLRNGVFQNMRCSIEELPGGAVAWSPVYIISDSGSVPPSLFPLPQYTPSGTCFSVMSITTDTAMLCRTLEDSAGIDCSYLRLPFPMLNAALPLGLSSNDSRVNCFLTCRQDGALCLLSLEPSGQTHVISKSCPLPYPSIPTGLFTSRFFDEFSHIVCIAGYEVAQDGKYLPVLALYNTILQEIMTSLESAEKFPTLGYWTLGSFLPFFSHLTVTAVEFLPTAAVEVNRRIIRASSNVASSGYLLVVLSDPGGLRWLSRKFKDQELGWLLVFRFQNCVPYVSISHPSSLELCGIQRFTDPITSICVAHPDMWVTSSSGLSQFKKPLIFVAVASRLVAYEVEYDSSKAPHDQIKFTLKTWYRTVEVVTSLSPLPDAILAGSLAGVVAYGFDYIERGTDSNNSRESRYHITLKRYSATSQQLKEVSSVVPTGPGEGVFMGLEIDKTGRVSFFKWKNSGESLMKPLMPQIRVGEASLGMKSLPVGLLSQAQYLFTRHQGMWRFEMRNLDAETLEAILAIQKEASSHWAVGGCCYDDFRFGGNGTGYVNPPPDLCDETAASVEGPAAIVISQSMGTEEQDGKKDPDCSSPIDDNGVDNGADGAAFLDGELLRKFVNAPLTVQKEILFGAGLLQGRNTNDRGGGLDELYKITTLVICVWQCIRR